MFYTIKEVSFWHVRQFSTIPKIELLRGNITFLNSNHHRAIHHLKKNNA